MFKKENHGTGIEIVVDDVKPSPKINKTITKEMIQNRQVLGSKGKMIGWLDDGELRFVEHRINGKKIWAIYNRAEISFDRELIPEPEPKKTISHLVWQQISDGREDQRVIIIKKLPPPKQDEWSSIDISTVKTRDNRKQVGASGKIIKVDYFKEIIVARHEDGKEAVYHFEEVKLI